MPESIACLPGGAFAEAQLTKILVNVCIGIGAAVVGWAVSSAISGNWDVDELRSALANAIFFTGVTVFISTSVSTLKYVGREPSAAADLAECAGNCFIAGTLVTTVDGLKPIEDIEVGDEVLAYDPETGEQAYKPVVRLFRNTTDKWYHVYVNEQDITCTAEHPFYVADLGAFVPAKDLKVGQSVLLADGSCAVIDGILVEELSTPETTYNFEVEDYHTYYVSKDKVLVHNICVEDDYYRGGSDFTARESDVRIGKDGLLKTTHGISINKSAEAVSKFGVPHKITSIPNGLNIIQRGVNPMHFEIVPAFEMSMSQYQQLLSLITALPV